MNFEKLLVESYLAGKLPLSAGAVQWLLNRYAGAYHLGEKVFGRPTTLLPPETEEIAARSAELMETHYNLPLEMFNNFLGSTMKYSMGLWEEGARNLEEAQRAMMADVCEKAGLRDGQTVLDLGCGFGSLACHILANYPRSRVWALTLSDTQADYIRALKAVAGHPFSSDRFRFIQADFNDAVFEDQFDRIFSLGVFEHISNITKALEKIGSFIAPDGLLLLHYIVYAPPPGSLECARQNPFMERYIFPGSRVWSQSELFGHQKHFRIQKSWYINGVNYQWTVRAWLENFRRNLAVLSQSPNLNERQLKIWEFYLQMCIAVFKIRDGNYYGNGQYLLRPREKATHRFDSGREAIQKPMRGTPPAGAPEQDPHPHSGREHPR